MYNFMSGDTSDNLPYKKKEETNLLIPEGSKAPIASLASSGVAVTAVESSMDNTDPASSEEKQGFIKYDRNDSKEASVDTNDRDDKEDDKDYLENNESARSKSPENKWEKDKLDDKVDSVYLRPPPPHKARSTASTAQEEDCGIKCLYYTLQCCDCVLM